MQLQGLSRIIGCFKPAECEFIREYYLRKNNGSATKRLQLFDLLNNGISQDCDHLCKILYNRKPDSGFSQLKKRLKEDLLDFLVFFSSGKADMNDVKAVELECRRLLCQARTLIHKGIPEEATTVLKKVQRLVVEKDLPDLHAQVLTLYQQAGFFTNEGESQGYADSIEHFYHQHLLLTQARRVFEELEFREGDHRPGKVTRLLLTALEREVTTSDSPKINYWLLLIKMRCESLAGNVVVAYRLGLRLFHLLTTKGACLTKGRHIDAILELTALLFKVRKYEKAQFFARKAEMLCAGNCSSALKVLEWRFVLHYANSEYEQGKEVLDKTLAQPDLFEKEGLRERWYFFEACMSFVQHDYEATKMMLQKSGGLSKNDGGIFLEHRILELLNLVELEEYDLFEYRVESFRKLVEYHGVDCTERVQQVMKLMRAFMRFGFNIKEMEAELSPVVPGQGLRFAIVDVGSWLRAKFTGSSLRMVG